MVKVLDNRYPAYVLGHFSFNRMTPFQCHCHDEIVAVDNVNNWVDLGVKQWTNMLFMSQSSTERCNFI